MLNGLGIFDVNQPGTGGPAAPQPNKSNAPSQPNQPNRRNQRNQPNRRNHRLNDKEIDDIEQALERTLPGQPQLAPASASTSTSNHNRNKNTSGGGNNARSNVAVASNVREEKLSLSDKRNESSMKYDDNGKLIEGRIVRNVQLGNKKRTITATTKDGNKWHIQVRDTVNGKTRIHRGRVDSQEMRRIFEATNNTNLGSLENIGSNAENEGSLQVIRARPVRVNLPSIGLIEITEEPNRPSAKKEPNAILKHPMNAIKMPEPRGKGHTYTAQQLDDMYTAREIADIAKQLGIKRQHDGKARTKTALTRLISSRLRKMKAKAASANNKGPNKGSNNNKKNAADPEPLLNRLF